MKHFMFAIAFSVALIGCADKEKTPAAPAPEPLPATDVNAGKVLAERDCKGCHGLDGAGTAPGIPDLAAQQERYLLESIAAYKEGKRTHAALKEMAEQMSEADVHNVVGYYASLPPIATTPETSAPVFLPYENGKALASACTKCHGADGNTTTPGVPSIAGQQLHYFVVAIQEYLNGVRKTDPMHFLLRRLSKLDVESLALYFANLLGALGH